MMIFGTTCHVFIQKQEICVCSLNNKSTMLVILYLHGYALCAMLLLSVCQEIGLVAIMFFFELFYFPMFFAISFYVSLTNSFSIIHFSLSAVLEIILGT